MPTRPPPSSLASASPGPSLRAQILAFRFQALHVGVTLRDAKDWHAIATSESVGSFEFGHGKDMVRLAYNRRMVARALRERATVVGEHAGFCDLFVPVPGIPEHVLITGPFARARPTSADVLTRWHWLTGRHGHPSEPEFAHYLSVTLGTLTLDGDLFSRYQRFVECYAELVSGVGGDGVFAEALRHASELERARSVEAVWETAREMVDETAAMAWLSPQLGDTRARLGVAGLPEHVMVGLVAGFERQSDPVDALLRQNALQRASVAWVRPEKAIAGRVGNHGVMVLLAGQQSAARARRAIEQIAARIIERARREFGLTVHVGTSAFQSRASLGDRYQQALGAAERALSRGVRLVIAEPASVRTPSMVRQLRADLAITADHEPKGLVSRFERYIDAVFRETGYRMDLLQVELETGFDQAARSSIAIGALGAQDYLMMCQDLDRAARDAATAKDLVMAYRVAVSDLAEHNHRPVQAARDRSLRRVTEFVERHFAEPLTVRRVARIAGFAPAYFGQLFKRVEGTTFQVHLRTARIEHAKRLLLTTDLGTERIAQLCGFADRHYFYRAFKLVTRTTPTRYRVLAKSEATPSGARKRRVPPAHAAKR